MEPLDERSLVIWILIVIVVAIVALAGMFLNRYFIRRAHRKALADLKYVAHVGDESHSMARNISRE
ncbi:MAG: hypothetical protein K2J65_05135 [Duncaniella sp.]|nr:hypothetical protein [Duncaniella sp.]